METGTPVATSKASALTIAWINSERKLSGQRERGEGLYDERLRAAFEAAFKPFTMSLETVLPRPEALPLVPDAKAFGAIAFAARRRYRDETEFDASSYGSKVRQLAACPGRRVLC